MKEYTVILREGFEANDASLARLLRFLNGVYGAYLMTIKPPSDFVEIP